MMKYLFAGIGSLSLLIAVVVGADTLVKSKLATDESATDAMIVFKSPTCGCCSQWIDHVEDNGFHTEARDVSNLHLIKREKGVEITWPIWIVEKIWGVTWNSMAMHRSFGICSTAGNSSMRNGMVLVT